MCVHKRKWAFSVFPLEVDLEGEESSEEKSVESIRCDVLLNSLGNCETPGYSSRSLHQADVGGKCRCEHSSASMSDNRLTKCGG
jgi:hypothetical protein